jgi:Ca2+-binding EF-hand superfamily protein
MPGVKIPGKIGAQAKFGSKKNADDPPAEPAKIKRVSVKKRSSSKEPAVPKAGQIPAPDAGKKQATAAKPTEIKAEPKKAAPVEAKPAAAPAKPAAPSAPKKPKAKKKKSTSSVFSQFEQQQIQEFKEAFQMIDQDRNGIIDVGDLKATYAALGIRHNDPDALKAMIAEADGATINFTVFLNMLADKLHGTDPEDVILKAFKVFDKDNRGVIHIEDFKSALMSQADRFDAAEFESVKPLLNINDKNEVDYKALCYTLCHGNQEEDEE